MTTPTVAGNAGHLSDGQMKHRLESLIDRLYPSHPFSRMIDHKNVRRVLASYFAMSQAFPYLQAGAQKDHIFRCLEGGQGITRSIEITSVVGSFLVWDEMGGHSIISDGGVSALPQILNTQRNFHANLLRKDLKNLFGDEINPDYDETTKTYLQELFQSLASPDDVTRCACMVAFEMHAGRMIEALWESLCQLFDVEKDNLTYFRVHVGGNDPAEPYHFAMTSAMIGALVSSDKEEAFFELFEQQFSRNVNWCAAITQTRGPLPRDDDRRV